MSCDAGGRESDVGSGRLASTFSPSKLVRPQFVASTIPTPTIAGVTPSARFAVFIAGHSAKRLPARHYAGVEPTLSALLLARLTAGQAFFC